jgi:hypothetical protein
MVKVGVGTVVVVVMGPPVPVPERGKTTVPFGGGLKTHVIGTLVAPEAVGLKTHDSVQVAPGLRVTPVHASPVDQNGGASTVPPATLVVPPPVFVNVKVCGELVVPVGTEPKSMLDGETDKAGGGSVVVVDVDVVVEVVPATVVVVVWIVVVVVVVVVVVGGVVVVVVEDVVDRHVNFWMRLLPVSTT